MAEEQAVKEVELSEEKAEETKSEEQNIFTEEDAKEQGVYSEEVKLMKEHGLIKEGEKKTEEKSTEKSEKETKESEDVDDLDVDQIVDDMESGKDLEPEVVGKLNKNAKGLYQRTRKEILKRQKATAKAEHTEVKLKLALKELEELKNNTETDDDDDDLFGTPKDKAVKENTKEEVRDDGQIKANLALLEREAEIELESYTDVTKLADALIAQDKTGKYAGKVKKAYEEWVKDPDSGANPAETYYEIGLIAKAKGIELEEPKEDVKDDKAEKKTDNDRIIDNLKKRSKTSAALGGSGTGKRFKSEDDLKPEDLANMDESAYFNLSSKTRERLLREL